MKKILLIILISITFTVYSRNDTVYSFVLDQPIECTYDTAQAIIVHWDTIREYANVEKGYVVWSANTDAEFYNRRWKAIKSNLVFSFVWFNWKKK